MKFLITSLCLVTFIAPDLFAQSVGIGTATPDSSAILELKSTTSGFLPPRLTETERNAISTPATGLVIFNTTSNSLEYRDNPSNQWNNLNLNSIASLNTGKLLVVYTQTNAYGFWQNYNNQGSWEIQALSSSILGSASAAGVLVLYNSSTAYGFTQRSTLNGANWLTQSLSGTPIGIVASGSNIVVYTSSNAYGYSRNGQGVGSWTSQSLTGSPVGSIKGVGSILLYTSSNAYAFAQYNNAQAYWNVQALDGLPLGAINSQ